MANDTVRVVQLNPAVIRRVGEMVERLVARCRQQQAPAQRDAANHAVPEWTAETKSEAERLCAQAQQPAQEAQKP